MVTPYHARCAPDIGGYGALSAVPGKTGLGIEIDPALVERHCVDR